jgi:GIY-YIG catalytic domain
MKYYVYALVDPRNYTVFYVGRTRQRMDKRLAEHIQAAKSGNPRPVYEWLRSLLPGQPWLVCLETATGLVKKRGNAGWRDAAEPCEVKWIKRFRRTVLNAVGQEVIKTDWKMLVNRDEAS